MAAPYGSQNSTNESLTVYETCKKIVESRKSVQQNCKSQNENSNFFQACKQYVERQEKMKWNIEVELQSTMEKLKRISNKPELFVENMDFLLQKLPAVDQNLSEKRTDTRFNKKRTETNLWQKSQKLKMKLFACPKCEAKFEKILQLGLHFRQNHLKNRGGQFVVLKSSEMAAPQEALNSPNKRPTVYECDAKFEEILESELHFKQNHLENRGGACGVVYNSEISDPQEAQNSINKRPTVYECDAKFEEILDSELHFKQNHLENRGDACGVLKSSEMADPQEAQNSINKRPTVYVCDAKFEEILESGLHFKQNHLENRGGACDVLKSSEMADPQEAQNSINKRPTVYECNVKFEEILDSELHFKQNHLENRGGACGVLKSSEMADPQEAQNSINKRPTVCECNAKFEEILDSELHFKQNHLENRGDACGVLKSSEMADSQAAQNSINKRPTVYECDAKFEEILDSELHFKQNHLENRGGACGLLKSCEMADPQAAQNSINKRPTVYECDAKFEEILDSELHFKQNNLENRGGACDVLKSSEMADPQEAQNSINKRPTVYKCNAKFGEVLETELHFKQNHLENRGGPCGILKSSEMADSHGAQNYTNKRLSVYESCKKIIEARNQVQKSLPQTNSSDFDLRKPVQQNCKPQNENSIFFQLSKQQQKRNDSLGMQLFACPECDGKFEGEHKFALHLLVYHAKKRRHLAKPMECNLCQKIFPSEKDYAIHFQSHVVESQQLKMNDIEVELQSSMQKISHKSESFAENMNSILEKLPTVDQDLSENKTNSRFLKESTKTNSWLKSQNLKMYLFACPKCDAKFERGRELMLHLQENHSEKRGHLAIPVECKLCQNIFPSKKDYAIHFQSHVIEKQQQKMNNIEVEFQSAMKKISNKSELFAENMNSILEKLPTVDQDLSAQKTNSRFNKESTEKNLGLKSQNLKMKLFACPKCDAKYEGERELVLHFRVNHSNKRGRLAIPVKCTLCQSIFPSKKDYIIHFRTHSEKKHASPSSQKLCLSHSSKNAKDKKPRRSVWDACKKVLNEKSSQQVSSANSKCVVSKLPISKKAVFMNTSPKILDDLQLDNLVHFKTEAMDVAETDNSNFSCNMCDISFKEIEKYEAHYSTHLDKELCQIREGDEELQVCNVCGGCFTEINTFQAHMLTHVKKEMI